MQSRGPVSIRLVVYRDRVSLVQSRGSHPYSRKSSLSLYHVIETSEVVVSATKTPVPVSHLTSAVEVITGEELERKKIKTVIEGVASCAGRICLFKWRPRHGGHCKNAGSVCQAYPRAD